MSRDADVPPASEPLPVPSRMHQLPLKVGVMGGAGDDIPDEYLAKAETLGKAIAAEGCITVTGGCPGLPLAAARGAKAQGGTVIGISPGLSLDEHVYQYESPTLAHDVLIFTGSGLMGREVVNIRTSDVVVIVGGGSGTLGELAIAYDEAKLIGVLTGTGGISDVVGLILAACSKETGARLVYNDDPQRLVTELLHVFRTKHYRRPSVFCRDTSAPQMQQIAGTEKDVVCGMWIPPDSAAAKRSRHGRTYVLCSLECAERFDANPVRYAETTRAPKKT
jgi:uncharacterized protein (TIGR00725 family)